MRKHINTFENFNLNESLFNDPDIQAIIKSIPDSDIPSEIHKVESIGDKIIYIEGWCDRCFYNYDVDEYEDRDEKIQIAEDLTYKRLKGVPQLPQHYKEFSGKELVEYKFIELPDNDLLYGLSVGIYA